MIASSVPELRIRTRNAMPVREGGDHVLYWMIASRRTRHNFGLERAIAWATALDRPLVVLEALRCGYRWASDRLHRFVIDGMADNTRRFAAAGVLYHPYVEPAEGAGKGLLGALAARACVLVTDDFPCFFLPRMVASAARQVPVRLEQVDSNGLLPVRAADRVFTTARSFRIFWQRVIADHLGASPAVDPLKKAKLRPAPALPRAIARRWPAASPALLGGDPAALSALPIDHAVPPAPCRGGPEAAGAQLSRFVAERLPRYLEERDHPDAGAASGLSPYLHFGHLSAHEVFAAVARREGFSPDRLGRGGGPAGGEKRPSGSREGFWGMSPSAEAFLEQLVTWRELGFNAFALGASEGEGPRPAWKRDPTDYESLPDWALATLAKHERDARPRLYPLEALAAGATYDRIWNASQGELLREGRIHNYLRMLWGKKILEWSRTPREALAAMVELNNRYALDGRDPNSTSGIFWVLGRYDRAWGPERQIFGTVRYMSSDNTARKLHLKEYLARYGR
ncbi:deoxyribodipyrimidine photolyase [Sorangium cellulosum]|uniref:Deoxyribodipyrimidine photo-lyase n=1 Tax=Sorangium cellulosum TaxID=56 RepID=A0A2L0F3M8_SORCE|nr:deoxyribodipyrimidine photolyase [Sorangium cellulosum]AUX46137.1 deoxyribodipyrimidine photolyase [Sorangium cellulosum]